MSNPTLGIAIAKGLVKRKVEMDKDELIEEHKHLVKILRKGKRSDLMKEARKQEDELNEYIND